MAEPDTEQGAGLPVGEYLRRVRESRGLQLDEASRVTKIGKNYLAAIEEGQFDKLPNAAYIRGFLRLYAGFLSLSGDEVVRRYEEGVGVVRPPAESRPQQERPRIQVAERAKTSGPGKWVISVILLVLVLLAAFFMKEEEPKRVRPAVKPSEPPAAPAPAAVQPQRSSATQPPVAPPATPAVSAPAPGTTPAGTPQAAQPPAPGTATAPVAVPAPGTRGVVLRLHFNKDSWLSITIDDSISQRYDLKAGDVIEWKGTRSFVLDIGDGSAADGDFNGRPLKPLGEAGKPAHVELKAAGSGNQEMKGR